MVCKLCGSADLPLFYTQGDQRQFKFYRCKNCQLVLYDTVTGVSQEKYILTRVDPRADTRQNRGHRQTFAFIKRHAPRPGRVLDLGCGDGEFTPLLASHGANVIGLDISTDLLGLARTRIELDGFAGQVRPLCGSAHVIPLQSDSVDLVFGMAVLHHLDLELAAAEVHRVLKPGGRAIFKEPMRNSRVVSRVRAMIPYRQPDISPFERPLRNDEIQRFASRFSSYSGREFELPFVSLLRVCGAPKEMQKRSYDYDKQALARWPSLRTLASVLVFEVRK